MNISKTLFLLFLVLCGEGISHAQSPDKRIYVGIFIDHALLNDQTIGDVPLKGLDAGLRVGFARSGREKIWGMELVGGVGFLNMYGFPSITDRLANRFFGELNGEYLHRIGNRDTRARFYLGGYAGFFAYYNDILVFTNSASNYFFHAGIAPKGRFEYPFSLWKKPYTFYTSVSYNVLGVVMRPSYILPFPGRQPGSVRLATLDSYGMAQIRAGISRRMRNGNAWELAYRWKYDFDSRSNNVCQAIHSLSFLLHVNL